MRTRIALCCVVSLAAALAAWYFVDDRSAFVNYYEKHLRGNLFAGLLTVGGFLLSLKTFILIKLKENVYDHAEYKATFEKMSQLDSTLKIYGPLQRLSDFLFYSVLSSILAAICQLTLGLFSDFWLSVACLTLAAFALLVLLNALFMIKLSLNDYFDYINKAP